ncbi:hypothetical protein GCM10027578_18500 [Spirosoma luteolum]
MIRTGDELPASEADMSGTMMPDERPKIAVIREPARVQSDSTGTILIKIVYFKDNKKIID